jgi:hypothetical protein
MILKIFSPKKLPFLAQTTASFCKNVTITLFFEKMRQFSRWMDHLFDDCGPRAPLQFVAGRRCSEERVQEVEVGRQLAPAAVGRNRQHECVVVFGRKGAARPGTNVIIFFLNFARKLFFSTD